VTTRPVIPRERAARDADDAVAHYLAEAGEAAALGFVAALQAAYRRIARYPGIGSPRHGQETGLDGLRSWPLRRYPYLVFYMDRGTHLDVWRVLHAKRDIPAWMQEPEPR
jgi:toxin ParE1/3/4